jgi:hypothetical protein
MQDQPIRPWREIAAQLTQETDSKKILKLCEELNRALDSVFNKSGKPESEDSSD